MSASRFWIVDDVNEQDGNTPTEWLNTGQLVGIVDESEGGIVAYCHADRAQWLVSLLAGGAK